MTSVSDYNIVRYGIQVLKGKDLPPMDLNGLSDPYVVIYPIGSTGKRVESLPKYQTKVESKTLNPNWQEKHLGSYNSELGEWVTFQLDLDAPAFDGFALEIFDKDRITKDDRIGIIRVTLDDIFAQEYGGSAAEIEKPIQELPKKHAAKYKSSLDYFIMCYDTPLNWAKTRRQSNFEGLSEKSKKWAQLILESREQRIERDIAINERSRREDKKLSSIIDSLNSNDPTLTSLNFITALTSDVKMGYHVLLEYFVRGPLAKTTHLTEVKFVSDVMDPYDDGVERFCALVRSRASEWTTLKKLDFCRCPLGDFGIKAIASLLEDPNVKLESLDLSYTSNEHVGHTSKRLVSAQGFRALANAIAKNTTLVELNLGNNDIVNPDVLRVLADALAESKSLRGVRVPSLKAQQVEQSQLWLKLLHKNRSIKKFEMELINPFTYTMGLEAVADIILLGHNNVLEEFVFLGATGKKEPLLAMSLHKFASALRSEHCNLRNVVLPDAEDWLVKSREKQQVMTDAYVDLFKSLRTVESIKIGGVSLSDQRFVSIAEAIIESLESGAACTNLRVLNIEDSKLMTKALVALGRLLAHPRCPLQQLVAKSCNNYQPVGTGPNLTYNSFRPVFEALKSNKSLTELDVSLNKQTEEDAAVLAESVKDHNTTLHKLDVASCQLTEAALLLLRDAVSANQNIEWVNAYHQKHLAEGKLVEEAATNNRKNKTKQ